MELRGLIEMAVLRKRGVASRRLVLMSTVFVLAACESSNATDSAASPSVSDESQTAIAVPSPTPIGDQGTELLKYFGTFTSDGLGQIELTGILDIEGYHTVNLEILAGYADQVPDLRVTVDMGKITGSTLADEVDRFTIAIPDIHIHTYSVIGPELVVWVLGAPPKHRRRYPGLGLSQLSAQVVAVSRSIPTSSARSVRSFSQPISSSAKVRLSG